MMTRNFFIIVLIATIMPPVLCNNLKELTTPPTPTQKNMHEIINENHQHIIQDITITIDKKDNDCSLMHGTQLRECLACQSKEKFIAHISALNDPTALAYWRSLTFTEYVNALKNFTEDDWTLYWKSRTQEYQNNFPPTLEAQRLMIKKIYVGSPWIPWIKKLLTGKSHDHANDLEKIMQSYDKNCDFDPQAVYKRNQRLLKFEIARNQLFEEKTKKGKS
ncbi:MAG: hypothetical protein NTX86_03195 [Candidatus Dependentiae bacterium]|nr:hypothetical protein [Candidatus Dependentiae bacterium]